MLLVCITSIAFLESGSFPTSGVGIEAGMYSITVHVKYFNPKPRLFKCYRTSLLSSLQHRLSSFCLLCKSLKES